MKTCQLPTADKLRFWRAVNRRQVSVALFARLLGGPKAKSSRRLGPLKFAYFVWKCCKFVQSIRRFRRQMCPSLVRWCNYHCELNRRVIITSLGMERSLRNAPGTQKIATKIAKYLKKFIKYSDFFRNLIVFLVFFTKKLHGLRVFWGQRKQYFTIFLKFFEQLTNFAKVLSKKSSLEIFRPKMGPNFPMSFKFLKQANIFQSMYQTIHMCTVILWLKY